MISVAEALERIVGGVAPVGAEDAPLPDALGRVLAEDVRARITNPPVSVSAMDGYAVRFEDVVDAPVRLRSIGVSAAGRTGDSGVRSAGGKPFASFDGTGAPLPEGADAIVIQENTDANTDGILVKETPNRGRFIRPAGLDFNQGDTLLNAGRMLTENPQATLASPLR